MHKYQLTILLSSADAANYLKIKESTLRRSRVTGKLFGISAPAYLKIGKAVRYDQSVIDLWLKRNSIERQG